MRSRGGARCGNLSPGDSPKAGNLQHRTPQNHRNTTSGLQQPGTTQPESQHARVPPARSGFFEGFGGVLGVILDHFGRSFLALFRTLRKKAGPHGTLVNSMQIEGRAPRKTSKKPPENDRKNDMKTKTEKGGILEAFCPHFGRLFIFTLPGCKEIE